MTRRVSAAQIAQEYREKIDDGHLQPGDTMPSLTDVAAEYDVDRTTANRAFRLLKADGYTYARPGIGTVVAARPAVVVTGSAKLDRMERGGSDPVDTGDAKHRAARRSIADPIIAELLEVELHDEVVVRERVTIRANTVTVVQRSVFRIEALEVLPELMAQGPTGYDGGWWAEYERRTGHALDRSPERRSARFATVAELTHFGYPDPALITAPVLVLYTAFHGAAGPVCAWEDVYRPGLWQTSK
ncbi:GntR family transcriptional regulator [Streptomyces sp. NPDC023838]|uniref:GntR family transcriptional regulator n=1 Tax=Streptomyces sp. NPDC023838 TaxID=3154325 RepID=UPI0033CC328D